MAFAKQRLYADYKSASHKFGIANPEQHWQHLTVLGFINSVKDTSYKLAPANNACF
jgi:hypothetical protein